MATRKTRKTIRRHVKRYATKHSTVIKTELGHVIKMLQNIKKVA